MIKDNKIYIVIIFISLVISAYSQSPSLQADTSPYTIIWILPISYILLKNKLNLKPLKSILICFIIFQVYARLLELIMPQYVYSNDTNIRFSPIAIFILIIGACSYKLITLKTFQNLLLYTSFISIVYLILSIHSSGYMTASSSLQYATAYKNQISPILVSHLCIISCFLNQRKLIIKLLYYVLLATTLYVIFSLKSRGGMLSALIMLLFLAYYFKEKKTINFFLMIIMLTCIYFYCNWESYKEIVFQNILKNSYDLTTLSSGRNKLWNVAFERLKNNLFFGVGQAAGNIENFYLQNLTAFGLIGFWISISFVYIPIKKVYINFNKKNQIELVAALFILIYCLNGLFERTPPVGPGIRCFYLWFILGYVISMKYAKKISNIQSRHK